MTENCVATITKMLPNLRSLELENCYDVGDEGVVKAVANCPRLENLQLEQCFKITDWCLAVIAASCPSLGWLKVTR